MKKILKAIKFELYFIKLKWLRKKECPHFCILCPYRKECTLKYEVKSKGIR